MGNEQITIKELLSLPEKFFRGLSEINLETTLKRILKPRNPKGKKEDGQDYNFWAQYLVVADGTGEIGIDITVGKEEETIPTTATDKRVKITGAKTDIYPDKKTGKDVRKLTKGKVILLEEVDHAVSEKEISGKDKVPREVWQKKDRLITRTAIAKSLIEAGRKWSDETEAEAIGWYEWVSSDKEEFANEIEEIEAPESDMLEEKPATNKQKERIRELFKKLGYTKLRGKPLEKALKTITEEGASECIGWAVKQGEESEDSKLDDRIDALTRELQRMVDGGEIDGKVFDDIITRRFDAKTNNQKEKLIKEIERILKRGK